MIIIPDDDDDDDSRRTGTSGPRLEPSAESREIGGELERERIQIERTDSRGPEISLHAAARQQSQIVVN